MWITSSRSSRSQTKCVEGWSPVATKKMREAAAVPGLPRRQTSSRSKHEVGNGPVILDLGRFCLFGGPRECGGLAVQGMTSNDSETVLDG
jgi:hypothetical protein